MKPAESGSRPSLSALVAVARVAALLSAALLVALVLGEGVVRSLSPQPPSWLQVYAPGIELPYGLAPGADQLVDTGETNWRVRISDAGYRAPSKQPPPPRTRRHLLGVGDSFAFGHGVNFDDTFYARLDRMAAYAAIRNAAVPGYGPREYRQVVERDADAAGIAGIVVTTFLGNDFHDCLWDKRRPVDGGVIGADGGWKSRVKMSSHLYRLFAGVAHALGTGNRDLDLSLSAALIDADAWERSTLREAREVYELEFRRIRDLAAARELPLLVLVLPPRAAVDARVFERAVAHAGIAADDADASLATAHASAILAGLGIRYVDLTGVLRESAAPVYYDFDGHLRAHAHQALASAVVDEVLSLVPTSIDDND